MFSHKGTNYYRAPETRHHIEQQVKGLEGSTRSVNSRHHEHVRISLGSIYNMLEIWNALGFCLRLGHVEPFSYFFSQLHSLGWRFYPTSARLTLIIPKTAWIHDPEPSKTLLSQETIMAPSTYLLKAEGEKIPVSLQLFLLELTFSTAEAQLPVITVQCNWLSPGIYIFKKHHW